MKLFLVIFFITCGVICGQDKSENEQVKYTIDNCVTYFNPDEVDSTKVGWQFWFVDKKFADGFTLKMSNVEAKKATHPPHAHQEDEIFYVVEGKAEFILGDEKKTGGPNSSFYCPTGVPHGIRNIGDGVLKYLVIKTYLNVK
ncbi:MAG: cupin domain-containing protein [Calditrichaeota bacterium]|nr:MAG: cupin domain-containing protein [Calditrichota bacterium]MBL1204754.1 cupin domain-containing protein [Calditrichota bacterium]NOG44582.1 cupin domain-containing protein [Calditrichota bacterium]